MKVSAGPLEREAARLHADMLRERKRYQSLQEQHSDLLGLLAQQEVELTVFRTAIEETLGVSKVLEVELDAQQNVVRMYGSYTNFRQYSMEDSVVGSPAVV